MGLDVYVEDQIHRRERVGADANSALDRLIAESGHGGLLADIFEWGDIMFNRPQLMRLDIEIQELGAQNSEISEDVALIRNVIESAMRKRGCIWISGD